MAGIEVVKADITRETSDAIVNAANPWLENGGGVAGAIHRAAGSALHSECMSLPVVSKGYRCPPGEARITGAGNLKCRYVIHAVGPDCRTISDHAEQDRLLAETYRNSLALVAERGLKSVSFPSISTGIYSFSKERAVKIAAAEIAAFLANHPDVKVRICLLGHDADETKALYEQSFAAVMPCADKPSRKRPRSDGGCMDSAMLDLAFIMQRVNRQLSKDRKPSPGETAYSKFNAIDYDRLCSMADSDPEGRWGFAKYVYGEVKKSEASGWREYILKPFWKPELYDSKSPEAATSFDEWSFSSPLAVASGIKPRGSVKARPRAVASKGFPSEISYNDLVVNFHKTINGSTCPRHGFVDGVHYIAKCETFQQLEHRSKTTSEEHVHNEFVADGVIRGMGFNAPESREYRATGNHALVRLAKYIEPTTPLCDAWNVADSGTKEVIRRQVVAAYPLQHLIAGFDTFQNDNVLVDGAGKLWFVDNGASFGWSAMGAYNRYFDYNERRNPMDTNYGFLSLRDHISQKLLQSILHGVPDSVLWTEMARFDIDKFTSLLPAGEYDVAAIRQYAETLIREAKAQGLR